MAFVFYSKILPIIRWDAHWKAYDAVYQEYYDLANEALYNGDYLTAAKYYHEIAVVCVDKENYATTRCYEGICYLEEAIRSSEDSIKNNMLTRSYQVLSEIYDPDYADTRYYYFALSKISEIYEIRGYSYDREDWVQLISLLDSFAELDQEQVFHNFFYDQTHFYNDVMTVVYSALASYYSYIDYDGIPSIFFKDYNEKIQKYLSALIELKIGESIDISSDAYLIARSANALIHGAMYLEDTSDAIASIEDAIALCNNYLDTFQLTSENIYAYSTLKHFIGKGYSALYFYEDKNGNKQDDLLQMAYITIQPLLDINSSDPNVIQEISTATFYMLTSQKCSETDINKIIYFSKANLLNREQSDLPIKYLLIEYYTCSAICQYILNDYNYNEQAYELGLDTAVKLQGKASLLDETFISQEDVDSLIDYYLNYKLGMKAEFDSEMVNPELAEKIASILDSSESIP